RKCEVRMPVANMTQQQPDVLRGKSARRDGKAKKVSESLGFREGTTSVHTSRTMMFDELSLLLEKVGASANADAYLSAIIEENVLGKPTQTTRQRSAKRLTELY